MREDNALHADYLSVLRLIQTIPKHNQVATPPPSGGGLDPSGFRILEGELTLIRSIP